jgi:hypothetical protein
VFYLLEATHLGNAVSFYLNNVNCRAFRPYDLYTVPQSKVKLNENLNMGRAISFDRNKFFSGFL